MHKFSFDQKVLSSQNVVIQQLKGESVLLNLQTEEYFGLDDVGTRMWHTLTNKQSIQAAINTLQVDYQVALSQLQMDVENLISELLENGLVEVVAA